MSKTLSILKSEMILHHFASAESSGAAHESTGAPRF